MTVTKKMPLLPLILLFIGMPLLELAILIKVGTILGLLPTVALVVVTGILGASMARAQGFAVLHRIRKETEAGSVPAAEVFDGLLILIGGLVLLTPGLITDALGFSLLVPWVRRRLRVWLSQKFSSRIVTRQTTVSPHDDVIDI